jgi:NADH-quinone oxidoreductase subunit L
LVGAIVGIVWAYIKYIKQNQVPAEDSQIIGFPKVLYNKYYVDEIYMAIIVNPINAMSRLFRDYFETTLSAMVFGLGSTANGLAAVGRSVHNGNIGRYFLVFILGVCAIISYLFLAQ